MTANIRRGTMVPKVEPRGADSHSILSINFMEGGVDCMDYAVGVGNPLKSITRTSSRFSVAD